MRKQSDGQTNLQVIDSSLNVVHKGLLRDYFQKLNDIIDLGPDYPAFYAHAYEAMTGLSLEAEGQQKDQAYANTVNSLWDAAGAQDGQNQADSLSRLLAMNQLWLEAHENGDEHPLPKEAAVNFKLYMSNVDKTILKDMVAPEGTQHYYGGVADLMEYATVAEQFKAAQPAPKS